MKTIFILLTFVLILVGCGSDGDTKTIGILSTPNDARVLGPSESLTIVFDRSFEGTYTFEGDLGSQVNAVLSTTNVEDDTLTMSPLTTWTSGNSLNLIININTSVGIAREIVLSDYEVL